MTGNIRTAALSGAAVIIFMRNSILTVTLNPAIDRIVHISHGHKPGLGNFFAGGKGINVARAARRLGAPVKATGVEGGVTGWMLEELLSKEGLPHDLFIIGAETRVNTTRVTSDGRVERVLHPGPRMTRVEHKAFEAFFARQTRGYGTIVFSGSLPPGFPLAFWMRLLKIARRAGACVVVDTSAAALAAALKCGVDIIKPNRAEAEEVLGRRLRSKAAIKKALHTFLGYGIKKVLISLGHEGLAACEEGRDVTVRVPCIKEGHAVGCGDAALAGFLVADRSGKGLRASACFAAACGTANLLCVKPGDITKKDIQRIGQKVRLEKE